MSFANAALALETSSPAPNSVILDDIKPNFDLDLMIAKFQPSSARLESAYRELIIDAQTRARPKAAFKACRIELSSTADVYLDGIKFTSQLLRDNLAGSKWAFAYVATEGPELVGWTRTLSPSMRYFSWPIRYATLKLAEKAAAGFIKSKYCLEQLSSMNPGSLNLWPITEQIPLFNLLGALPESIGISLDSNNWMSPDLTSSGIFFHSSTEFCNCQLCPRETCDHRRTAYQGPAGWPIRRNEAEGGS